MPIEFGTVKVWKNGYGFIKRAGKPDLYFHHSGFAWPKVDPTVPEGFSFEPPQLRTHRLNTEPKEGDVVVVIEGKGPRGLQAIAWCYEKDYSNAKSEADDGEHEGYLDGRQGREPNPQSQHKPSYLEGYGKGVIALEEYENAHDDRFA